MKVNGKLITQITLIYTDLCRLTQRMRYLGTGDLDGYLGLAVALVYVKNQHLKLGSGSPHL